VNLKSAVGIDGCKAGWVCIAVDDAGAWEARVLPDISSVWDTFSDRPLLLIDVPIGLVEKGENGRPCDVAARRVLGFPRASSVFSPPARPSLTAPSREVASENNYRLTGKRITVQTWGIVPKIREVDDFLRANPQALAKIREVHPEVLFWGLNGGLAIKSSKKTKMGSEERLEVLERFFPQARQVCEHCTTIYRRSELALDDAIDALVAALAGAIGGETLRTLPATPTRDPKGIPMEMAYLRV